MEELLETTTETITEVEPVRSKSSKFTVIKHKENTGILNTPEWDFNNNKDIQNVNSSNGQMDEGDSEGEDYFDENREYKGDNAVNCRDAEGQDTITSMSNKQFLKRVGKRPYSLKTSFIDPKAAQQTDSQVPLKDLVWDLESLGSSISGRASTLDRPLSTNSGSARYLESQTSLVSLNSSNANRRESLLNFIMSDTTMSTTLVPVESNNNEENICVSTPKLEDPINNISMSRRSTILQEPVTKSDHVFDVIKVAIENNDKELLDREFIAQVVETLRLQQRNDKKRKENVKRLCRIMELTTFFLIIIMTVFLIYNVSLQLQRLHRGSNIVNDISSQ